MILHADWPGVVFLDANVFDSDNIAIVEFEFDDPRLGKSLRKHLRFLGRKYDGWKLWNWAWTIMLRRWIKQKLETPIEDPKKIICVDFIIRILNDAGITNLSLGAFTPAEFLDWLNKNHAEKKKETTEHPKKTS